MKNDLNLPYKLSLSQFRPIIKQYKQEFNQVLKDANDPMTGLTVPEHQDRLITTIRKFKKLSKWKQNLLILKLHYKDNDMISEMLQIKKSCLNVYLTRIKKELR